MRKNNEGIIVRSTDFLVPLKIMREEDEGIDHFSPQPSTLWNGLLAVSLAYTPISPNPMANSQLVSLCQQCLTRLITSYLKQLLQGAWAPLYVHIPVPLFSGYSFTSWQFLPSILCSFFLPFSRSVIWKA
jgi:hypothetical protein